MDSVIPETYFAASSTREAEISSIKSSGMTEMLCAASKTLTRTRPPEVASVDW